MQSPSFKNILECVGQTVPILSSMPCGNGLYGHIYPCIWQRSRQGGFLNILYITYREIWNITKNETKLKSYKNKYETKLNF
jgi:hypothetical protein